MSRMRDAHDNSTLKDTMAKEPKQASWPIDKLKLADYNPRSISRSRLENLKRSMTADPDFLKVRPIIVNVRAGRYGIVIGGHMRLLAARALGWSEIPVVEVDVDARTEKAWNLKDNSHHGEWDNRAVAEMVLADPLAFEMAMPTDVLDQIFDEYGDKPGGAAKASEEEQAEKIAEAPKPITQPGDVWDLGEHRLVCGDSTKPATFAALMGEEKADMTFTDPPYNVDYGNHDNPRWGKKHEKIANDKMSDGAWAEFVRAFLARIKERTAGAVYICMSCKEWPSLHAAFVEAGFHWSTTVLWVKDVFTLGRSDYQRQHEPIMVGKTIKKAKTEPVLYGWPKGVERKWNGGRDEGDAWFLKRPRSNPVHPTQKPVELVAKAIVNSSNRGDVVLDCFAGGGVYPHRLREDHQARAAR